MTDAATAIGINETPACSASNTQANLQHITLHSFSSQYSIASFSSDLDTNLCAMSQMNHTALKCSGRGKTQNKNEQANLEHWSN